MKKSTLTRLQKESLKRHPIFISKTTKWRMKKKEAGEVSGGKYLTKAMIKEANKEAKLKLYKVQVDSYFNFHTTVKQDI